LTGLGGMYSPSVNWNADTDLDGRVEWTSAPPGQNLHLCAWKRPDFAMSRGIMVKADGEEHVIHLHRTFAVSGRVTDARTGELLQGELKAFPGYGEGEHCWYRGETRRSTNGIFQVHFDQQSSLVRLRVEADGYVPFVSKIWKQPWVVDTQAAGSGENALAYLARYVFKTATGNRPLQLLPSGKVLWPYRDSNTGQHQSIPLEPTELIRRFLQHVLPQGFHRVRLFGWLHPAAKVRGNRVRALLKEAPILTSQEQKTWLGPETTPEDFDPAGSSPEAQLCPTPICPHCGKAMISIGSWRPAQRPLIPTLPRPP
jgi:hypothetical protein